ncbi:hypothetical protein ASPZODRAFT_22723 [Penicilliopsis zonata CBS 506.65]|uniref:Uncharacterized protein n=1 Tax=Penicilliopsis zonata CBS 506.65 TaxID=1073090 RepID=A0A1L9SSC8_9EURO|nr:hypothetical protein ASPZODRAFT_22723 [Penicilliopsis zonata CBS 506.65]OJJ50024.1 hypothetical protein ASPZODRAFT_22723 [Penicilliopsis zonata CBS 506.65]
MPRTQHSIELRVQALALVAYGVHIEAVVAFTGIPRSTILCIVKKVKARGYNPEIDPRIKREMPVYLLHGFRWPRGGFTGIRVYIVLNNLEEAAAEYVQQPLTSRLVLESLKKTQSAIMRRLPDLQLIEQYDPEDTTSETAVSQPFAYVADKVITLSETATGPQSLLSASMEEFVTAGSGYSEDAIAAFAELRDNIAAGENIGWYVVYNGDPERGYPEIEEDSMDYQPEEEDEEEENEKEEEETSAPPAVQPPVKSPTSRFPERLKGFFGKKSSTATAV